MDDKPIQPAEDDDLVPHENQTYPNSDPESESDTESLNEASIKSTRSYSSLALQHIHENGRRYADETYFMPNDEPELTRLNILHQIYLILLEGTLTTAPLPQTPRILDIGTGPGDWAIEMSAAHPTATIIASDLTVFDSGVGHLDLPNVDFQLADARTEWTYHEPFDLIHLRGLSGAFQDWAAIYTQAFEHCKPGGYIEVADSDPAADTITFSPLKRPESEAEIPALRTYTAALRSAANAAGYPRDLAHLNTDALVAAGFVDVRVLERTIPIGLWPEDVAEKTLGKMALIALVEGLEGYALRPLTAFGGYTVDGVRELCEAVRGELLGVSGLTVKARIVTGRRPVSFAQKKMDLLARVMARAKIVQEGAEAEGEE
ncbi:uncharacterized protein N7473_000278 [Penicillium subrubescens]|uniref:Trans-aconitate 2-methyltransferase n=1 Tax=Penicillium subrubescens TaxID=1316194 RepID=A0A1Q5SP25_9EURO|nr:uncharacterized protein N7473_000278 [Penicillium subrubescens]KAJ5910975.1 hypothetical protein N7473_000278 [Penicillium subrubescens]OKO89673.1 hypothetical protein PENSUB_13739 [Penicillium subrubescens]